MNRAVRFLSPVAALVLGLALPFCAIAQDAPSIPAGIDVWTTPDDGATRITRFVSDPLPADYFCEGSPAFTQEIEVKGKKIATGDDGLGQTDTIVERLSDATLEGGVASTQIQVKAVSFEHRQLLSIPCADGDKLFRVRVTLDQREAPPVTDMTIYDDGSGTGGTFDATLTVPGKIVFTDDATGDSFDPLYDTIHLSTSGAPWADAVGTGGVDHSEPVEIDADGDGSPETTVPGTSNGFHTGWSNQCNPRCPVRIQHQGPHPTWAVPPPPPCRHETRSSVSNAFRSGKPNAMRFTRFPGNVVVATEPGGTFQPISGTRICKFDYNGTLFVVGQDSGRATGRGKTARR